MKQNKKIRLGLAGCGRVSLYHFESLKKLQHKAELVAVCDPSPEKLTAAVEKTGAKGYNSIAEMLAGEQLDAVTLSTPNGLHPQEIIQVANAGVNVITEKPMAIAWEDGMKAYTACKDKGVKLFVIHQNRFNETMQAVWKAHKEGRFGRIYMITSNVFWQRPQDYFDKVATWHGTKALDGGAYYTQASHYVDVIQWLAQSEPKSVYANLKTMARKIETEDAGMAIIEFTNGILSSMNVTVLSYPNNLEGSITIIGEKGTVKIGGTAMNRIDHWAFSEKKPEDETIRNASYDTSSVYGFGHADNYENIFQDLQGGEPALINGDEGLKSLKILCAIYDASKQGKPIVF